MSLFSSWRLLAFSGLLIGGISAATAVLTERLLTEDVTRQVAAVGEEKAAQVAQWLNERRGDAAIFFYGSTFAERASRWQERGARSDAYALVSQLAAVRDAYGYKDALLFGPDGEPLLSASGEQPRLDPEDAGLVEKARRARRVMMSELHADGDGSPVIDLVAPLGVWQDEASPPVGFVVLTIDPAHFFYAMLARWPYPTRTGEAVLVRRTGEGIRLLSPRPAIGAVPLESEVASAESPLIAAHLARSSGLAMARDVRGVEMVAYWSEVSGTDWLLTTMIESGEAFASVRATRFGILAAGLTVFLFTAALIVMHGRAERRHVAAARREADLRADLARRQTELLSRYANDVILLIAADGCIVEANDRAEHAYGYTKDELLGLTIRDLRAAETMGAFARQWAQSHAAGEALFETVHRRKDGSLFPVEVSSRAIVIDGAPYRQSIIRDITERRAAEQALVQQRETYLRILDESPAIIWCADAEMRCTFVNKAWETFGGGSAELLLGHGWAGAIHPEDAAAGQATIRDAYARRAPFEAEWRMRRADGVWRWMVCSGRPVLTEAGVLDGYIGIVQDVTERREAEEASRRAAATDALTGLANRAQFQQRLARAIRQRREGGQRLALLFVDLDGFKAVNDAHGHEAGDQLLVVMAERLAATVRRTDLVARIGGDEFVVLLDCVARPEVAQDVAAKIVERLSAAVPVGDRVLTVGASVGVALAPDHGLFADVLLSNADAAMYEAKRAGKNRWAMAGRDWMARDLVPWADAMAVGCAEIDDDHRRLVQMINAVGRALLAGDLPRARAGMADLAEQVELHFAEEERMLRAAGYPLAEAHAAFHASVVADVRALRERFFTLADGADGNDLAIAMAELFLGRILTADIDFAPYFAAPPQEAGGDHLAPAQFPA